MQMPAPAVTTRISGQGIFVYTYVDPIPGGGTLGEARLTQPIAMFHGTAWGGRLLLVATLDLEGLTIANGELTPGAWGEGFVDRRHPHTYAHELMLVATPAPWLMLAAGKGFVPFGSDDPMSRPVLRYPVNHHYAQILERAVTIAGVRLGPGQVEGALFNGDEPERPSQWPRIAGRFGDSWSLRLTLRPAAGGIELQGSRAKIHSPEHRPGAGSDQFKWSASLRYNRRGRYALIEWARASELDGFFVFHTLLAEVALAAGRHHPYYRFERTERPEETRTADPFRTVRPHLENSLLGITRWTIHTAGETVEIARPGAAWSLQPFVELSYGRIATVASGVFDPSSFYGRDWFWEASVGLRVSRGMAGHRMGRYGVSSGSAPLENHHSHDAMSRHRMSPAP